MMYESDFVKCMPFIFEREGGYVNDPDDPGGETKYGISKRAFPNEDIKNLSKERATELYYINYWLSCVGDSKWPLDLCIFDTAVNQGVYTAKKFRDSCDGDWKKYLELRRVHYLVLVQKRPKFKKYINGWLNRINELKKYIEEKG